MKIKVKKSKNKEKRGVITLKKAGFIFDKTLDRWKKEIGKQSKTSK